jgi:hypothetical protein
MKLTGHTLGVTTMVLLERHTLVSGSADKTIKVKKLQRAYRNLRSGIYAAENV